MDDILLTSSSATLCDSIMTHLSREFAMKDLGPLSFFLGISITQTSEFLFLSQKSYAETILERVSLSSCKPCATPIDTKGKLSAQSSDPYSDPNGYRKLVGSLQYLTFTRPDISYAVQHICLYMHDPRMSHVAALKRILCYIKGTLSHGLTLHKSSAISLTAYTDADWVGCLDTHWFTFGYCVFLGDNLVSWSSKH